MKKRTLYAAQFKGVSTTSKIIRMQTDGEYSHTAVYLDSHAKDYIKELIGESEYNRIGIDEMQFIEQWPHAGGVFDAWFDFGDESCHTPGTIYELWGLELDITDWKFCLNFYIRSLKEMYDWKGIAHFRIKSVKENPDKSFCSEKWIQPVVKIMGWNKIEPFNVHPEMVTWLIQAAGGKLYNSKTIPLK